MSAPPEKKFKVNSGSDDVDAPQEEEECSTISMAVGEEDCVSPITRINGYPWRLRVKKSDDRVCDVFLMCEKSMESELWNCEADIYFKKWSPTYDMSITKLNKYGFRSTGSQSPSHFIGRCLLKRGIHLEVKVVTDDNGNKCRPDLGPLDGILLIGNLKIHINKESLASQSPFFDRLFNGDFKEKNMEEIAIGDVSFKEFSIFIRIVYGKDGSSVVKDLLTRENVHRILELADRFDLKIVEDGVVNWLLSYHSPFSNFENLLIADQHGLTIFKNRVVSQFNKYHLIHVMEAPEFRLFSIDTKDSLMKRMTDYLKKLVKYE